jgi:hypothetical protein
VWGSRSCSSIEGIFFGSQLHFESLGIAARAGRLLPKKCPAKLIY